MITELLPIRMISTVIRGFGRGSSELGIATANLDLEHHLYMHRVESDSTRPMSSFEDIPCGIYWGYGRVGESLLKESSVDNRLHQTTYTTAISIGYNPTYGNDSKTIEPHFIAPESDPRRHSSSTGETVLPDFYDCPIRLSLVGYLRPELPFEGLGKLIEAIKNDIARAVELSASPDTVARRELEWIKSEEQLSSNMSERA